MNRLTRLGLLAVAVAACAGCGTKPGKKPRPHEVERIPRLETITPKLEATFEVKREYTATVEAKERARINPQVRGTVAALVDIGRRVRGADTPFPAPAAAGAVGLLNGNPFLGAALLVDELEADVLARLDIPEALAERDNKRALLRLAQEARGQAVKAREVARREVKEAEAQQKRYSAEADFRAMQYKRMVRLVKQDTVQKQQAEEAELQHKSALAGLEAAGAYLLTKQARLQAAEGEIRVAERKVGAARTELEKAETLVGFGTVRAPFNGVVTRRWGNLGETTTDLNKPLLTVMRTDVVRVVIDVPERDVAYIRGAGSPAGGNRVTLRVPALQDRVPQGKFVGPVTLTASALDPVTRTMRAETWLANPDGLLRPQMTGTATVVLQERKNVFTVPSSALVWEGDEASLYCVVAKESDSSRGVVRRLKVKVGVDNGQVAEVHGLRSRPLTGREQIITPLTGREQIITKGNGVVREGDFAIAVPAP
jgi:HlyD family secretion protein